MSIPEGRPLSGVTSDSQTPPLDKASIKSAAKEREGRISACVKDFQQNVEIQLKNNDASRWTRAPKWKRNLRKKLSSFKSSRAKTLKNLSKSIAKQQKAIAKLQNQKGKVSHADLAGKVTKLAEDQARFDSLVSHLSHPTGDLPPAEGLGAEVIRIGDQAAVSERVAKATKMQGQLLKRATKRAKKASNPADRRKLQMIQARIEVLGKQAESARSVFEKGLAADLAGERFGGDEWAVTEGEKAEAIVYELEHWEAKLDGIRDNATSTVAAEHFGFEKGVRGGSKKPEMSGHDRCVDLAGKAADYHARFAKGKKAILKNKTLSEGAKDVIGDRIEFYQSWLGDPKAAIDLDQPKSGEQDTLLRYLDRAVGEDNIPPNQTEKTAEHLESILGELEQIENVGGGVSDAAPLDKSPEGQAYAILRDALGNQQQCRTLAKAATGKKSGLPKELGAAIATRYYKVVSDLEACEERVCQAFNSNEAMTNLESDGTLARYGSLREDIAHLEAYVKSVSEGKTPAIPRRGETAIEASGNASHKPASLVILQVEAHRLKGEVSAMRDSGRLRVKKKKEGLTDEQMLLKDQLDWLETRCGILDLNANNLETGQTDETSPTVNDLDNEMTRLRAAITSVENGTPPAIDSHKQLDIEAQRLLLRVGDIVDTDLSRLPPATAHAIGESLKGLSQDIIALQRGAANLAAGSETPPLSTLKEDHDLILRQVAAIDQFVTGEVDAIAPEHAVAYWELHAAFSLNEAECTKALQGLEGASNPLVTAYATKAQALATQEIEKVRAVLGGDKFVTAEQRAEVEQSIREIASITDDAKTVAKKKGKKPKEERIIAAAKLLKADATPAEIERCVGLKGAELEQAVILLE